jgi:AraC-like DNA-binding protein
MAIFGLLLHILCCAAKMARMIPKASDEHREVCYTVCSRPANASLLDVAEMLRFHILYFGYADVGPAWNTHGIPCSDGNHHIHLVCGGQAQWRWTQGSLDLLPGHAYWAPAQTLLHRQCDESYRHFCLVFRCEWLPGTDLFWSCRTPVCLGEWNPRDHVSRWDQPTPTLSTLLNVHTLLYTLFAGYEPLEELIAQQQNLQGRFAPMFDLLRRRRLPDASLQVSQIAAEFGMTHNGFSRLFRRHFGTSPKAYLHSRINQTACELLATSDTPIRLIASQLGFSSEYYFNRFFHQLNGISPGRYRHLRGPATESLCSLS